MNGYIRVMMLIGMMMIAEYEYPGDRGEGRSRGGQRLLFTVGEEEEPLNLLFTPSTGPRVTTSTPKQQEPRELLTSFLREEELEIDKPTDSIAVNIDNTIDDAQKEFDSLEGQIKLLSAKIERAERDLPQIQTELLNLIDTIDNNKLTEENRKALYESGCYCAETLNKIAAERPYYYKQMMFEQLAPKVNAIIERIKEVYGLEDALEASQPAVQEALTQLIERHTGPIISHIQDKITKAQSESSDIYSKVSDLGTLGRGAAWAAKTYVTTGKTAAKVVTAPHRWAARQLWRTGKQVGQGARRRVASWFGAQERD